MKQKNQNRKLVMVLTVAVVSLFITATIFFFMNKMKGTTIKTKDVEYAQLQTKAKSDSTTSADRLVMIQGLNTTLAVQKQLTAKADSATNVWKNQSYRNSNAGKKALEELKVTHGVAVQSFNDQLDLAEKTLALEEGKSKKLAEETQKLQVELTEQGLKLLSVQDDLKEVVGMLMFNQQTWNTIVNGRKKSRIMKWFDEGPIVVVKEKEGDEPGLGASEVSLNPKGMKKFAKRE